MKQIKMTRKEAERLLERYYDGSTTNEEERLIRIYLASTAADGGQLDADRAVMGFFCAKRAERHRTKVPKWIPIAAASIIVAAVFWAYGNLAAPDYIAYVNGVKYTNEQFVMTQMEQTMQTVGNETGTPTMETQMKAVFGATVSKQ